MLYSQLAQGFIVFLQEHWEEHQWTRHPDPIDLSDHIVMANLGTIAESTIVQPLSLECAQLDPHPLQLTTDHGRLALDMGQSMGIIIDNTMQA